MSRLILHVGVPKTGSSAIQSFLCRHAELDLMCGERLRYGVIRQNQLIRGHQLRRKGGFRPLGYLPAIENLAETLRALREKDFQKGPLLLSQESWYRQAESLNALAVNVPVDVVMFVRPQVEWLSSAWWQWFVWANKDGNPLHAWRVLEQEGALDWSAIARQFTSQSNVRKVSIRLFGPGEDVVGDFLAAIDGAPLQSVDTSRFRRNASLTTHHLAIYRALPWLRTANAGSMDAVLTKIWPFGGRPEGPIAPDLIGEIIDTMRESNERLVEFLPTKQAQIMCQDSRWWDVEAYKR